MIPISHPLISREEIRAVARVMTSGGLAQGGVVEAFEHAFAQYCGVSHAIAVSSGTAALHLALLAHGIGKGDEVITTPFSFIATSNAIRFVGARPVFADISPETFTLDPKKAEEKISQRTKALLPVSLFGCPADLPRFVEISRRYGLCLIEDACQAHGATLRGKKTGSFSTGCFSFYPSKNMTTGEGGMITTNELSVAHAARKLRSHGMTRRYVHDSLGFNYRMTDIHAAIGLIQLRKLDGWNATRVRHATYFTSKLFGFVDCPSVPDDVSHVFHQYTIRIRKGRDLVHTDLLDRGIQAAIYYPLCIHLQPAYAYMRLPAGSFPEAERACRDVLSLPVHPGLRQEERDLIVTHTKRAVLRIV